MGNNVIFQGNLRILLFARLSETENDVLKKTVFETSARVKNIRRTDINDISKSILIINTNSVCFFVNLNKQHIFYLRRKYLKKDSSKKMIDSEAMQTIIYSYLKKF